MYPYTSSKKVVRLSYYIAPSTPISDFSTTVQREHLHICISQPATSTVLLASTYQASTDQGRSLLNATVTVFVPAEMTDMEGPHFLAHAETFNAPLTVSVLHDSASAPAIIRMQAMNNLGNTRLSVDSRYQGTFDVNTMFAQADVLAQDAPESLDYRSSDDGRDYGAVRISNYDDDSDGTVSEKVRMLISSAATSSSEDSSKPSTTSNLSRCLQYDLISSSEIQGWVGTPPRPSPTSSASARYLNNNMGHLNVVSSLSGAQLVLLT